MFSVEHLPYFKCLESDVGGTLRPRPCRTQVVAFEPEGGGNKEGWLLPDFKVLRTKVMLSVLSGNPRIETKSSGRDGEVPGGVPFWLLRKPNINPG